jgi:multiple sugar transport system permease protein
MEADTAHHQSGSESYQYLGAYVSSWSSVMAAAVLASVPALAPLLVADCFVNTDRSDEAVM